MIMAILGAGASYDSVPARRPHEQRRGAPVTNRPPLATELFSDGGVFSGSLQHFPQCHAVVPYLRSVPRGQTLEHVLETLEAEGESDPQRKRQMAAVRYYLHFVIVECEQRWRAVSGGITNQVTLIDQMRRKRGNEPAILVTFNYDRLLEDALESVGIRITDMSHYIRDECFKLFKLHGSVHWAREVETSIPDISEKDDRGTAR